MNQFNAAMAVSTYTYETLPTAEQQALPDEDELAAALEALLAAGVKSATIDC